MRNTRKRILLGVLAAAGLVMVAAAALQNASPTSVALVDLGRALNALDETQMQEEEFQAFQDEVMRHGLELRDRLETLDNELSVMSPDDPNYQAKQIEQFRTELQIRDEQKLAQALIAKQFVKLQVQMFDRLIEAAEEYATQEGYDLVVADDSSIEITDDLPMAELRIALASRRVVFAADTVDITDAMINFMNNQFKASQEQ
ncbi:MAG: OmpH family outer membrane protein [Planctomycetota bacterium]